MGDSSESLHIPPRMSRSLTRSMYKCLLFEYKTGQGLSQRSYLLSSPSHIHHHGIASSPDTLSSRQFEILRKFGMQEADWWGSRDSDTYDNRHLARICRLGCRDWAKRMPLGDLKLRIANGAVWYCVEDVWQVPSKRHWAWKFREIEWWVDTRHQDSRTLKEDRKAWYPKVSVSGPC